MSIWLSANTRANDLKFSSTIEKRLLCISCSSDVVSQVNQMTPAQAAAVGAVMSSKSTAPQKTPGTLLRKAAGKIWRDPTLDDWPKDDYRLFCGDLGNEVTDDLLANAFRKYSSFQKAHRFKTCLALSTQSQSIFNRLFIGID